MSKTFVMKAHQRLVREGAAFMPEPDEAKKRELAATLDNAVVREIDREMAKAIILKYEYLGNLGAARYFFGLFHEEYIAGVACFGNTFGVKSCASVCGSKYADKVITLVRGACVHWAHPHSASYLINRACELMVANSFNIFLSYGDPEAGEIGTVYQGANWVYCGLTQRAAKFRTSEGKVFDSRHLHLLTRDRSNKRVLQSLLSRGIRELERMPIKGTFDEPYIQKMSREEMREKLESEGCVFFMGGAKHRYVHFAGDRRIVRALDKALRWGRFPYPKRKRASLKATVVEPTRQTRFDPVSPLQTSAESSSPSVVEGGRMEAHTQCALPALQAPALDGFTSGTVPEVEGASATPQEEKSVSSLPNKAAEVKPVAAIVKGANKLLSRAEAEAKRLDALTPAQLIEEMKKDVFTPIKNTMQLVIQAQQRGLGYVKKILVAKAPLIAKAKMEFGQQGRRVPIAGKPTYNEWLIQELTIELPSGEKAVACSDRYVREVMADLNKALTGKVKELELPELPKAARVTRTKGGSVKLPEEETPLKLLAEAAWRISDTLLGTTKGGPIEPHDARVKKAMGMAESIKEAIADSNFDRLDNPQWVKSTRQLYKWLDKEHSAVLDAVFHVESEKEFAKRLQNFAETMAFEFYGEDKFKVIVEFVEQKDQEESQPAKTTAPPAQPTTGLDMQGAV